MISAATEQTVLGLPQSERAHLAHMLLHSLDAASEPDIQAIWLSETRRRADEIDTGKVKLVSGEELERKVKALFK